MVNVIPFFFLLSLSSYRSESSTEATVFVDIDLGECFIATLFRICFCFQQNPKKKPRWKYWQSYIFLKEITIIIIIIIIIIIVTIIIIRWLGPFAPQPGDMSWFSTLGFGCIEKSNFFPSFSCHCCCCWCWRAKWYVIVSSRIKIIKGGFNEVSITPHRNSGRSICNVV